MKNSILSILLLISFQATAQPVIHHAMDYVIGDTFSTLGTSIISNYVQPTGSNYTWDFSGLSATTTNSIAENKVIPISSVSYSTSYPSANFIINYIISSGSTKLCGFEYFQKGGISKDWGGVNLTINYPDTTVNKLRYSVPIRTTSPVLSMITSFSDSFSYSGTPFGTILGVTYVVADGYGTLLLPGHTYDSVLRTRTTKVRIDSATGRSIDTTITYRWYRDNYKTPLLQIDSFSAYAYGRYVPYYQVHYLLYENATIPSTVSTVTKESKKYTALFRDNDIIINGPFNNAEYQFALFDLSGKRLFVTKFKGQDNLVEIETNRSLTSGMYILNIISATDNCSIKMIKE